MAPGRHKKLELHLTKAGRRVVKIARHKHRVTPMRLVVRISSGGQARRAVLKEKLRPVKRKGKGKRHGARS